MIVKELIAELQKINPNFKVIADGCPQCANPVSEVTIYDGQCWLGVDYD